MNQVAAGFGFDHISGDAGLERVQDIMLVRVHGEQDYFHLGLFAEDFPRGIDAVNQGHGQVEDRHLRMSFFGQPYGVRPVRSLGNHREALLLEQRLQSLADNFMVVGQ